LFYQTPDEVLAAADRWVSRLPANDPERERWLLEVAGVFAAHESPRPAVLDQLLAAEDFRVRAYGALLIGPWQAALDRPLETLRRAVRDEHPRVRLAAVVSASYFPQTRAGAVATEVLNREMDPFLEYALRQSARATQPVWASALADGALEFADTRQHEYLKELAGSAPLRASPGEELYNLACLPCHQPEGRGLAGVYPPLAGSDWVKGDPERLIKIILHGLTGPVDINGERFQQTAPLDMPAMGGLTDEQIADVLTFVRAEFGDGAAAVSLEQVRTVRREVQNRTQPWTQSELQ
jgi:mono/diheme cytochrome c family protein